MILEFINLLNSIQKNPVKKNRGKYFISYLDVLISDLVRLANGRINSKKINKLSHFIVTLRRFWTRWSICKYYLMSDTKRSKVLFHVTEPNHLTQLVPIYNEINKAGISSSFVTTKPNILKKVKQSGLPLSKINWISFCKKYQFRFSSVVKDFSPIAGDSSQYKKAVQYIRMVNALHKWQLIFYEALLKYNGVQVVLVGNDLTFEGRLISRIADTLGIKTASIQHGYISKDWPQQFHVVSSFFLFGEASKTLFDKQNKSYTRSQISGAPYLDKFQRIDPNRKLKLDLLMQRLSLKSPYTLICLSGHGHLTSKSHYFEILNTLAEAINTYSKEQFVVKLHPKEKLRDYYECGFSKLTNVTLTEHNQEEAEDLDIFVWLEGCKSLITGNSSVAFEALLMGKPIISIDLFNEYPEVEFRKHQAAFCVSNLPELLISLDQIAINPNSKFSERTALLQKYFFRIHDRSASRRIADYVLNYADQ